MTQLFFFYPNDCTIFSRPLKPLKFTRLGRVILALVSLLSTPQRSVLRCFIRSLTIGMIWSDFDRASSLIYGNKLPTRCNRWFFIADLIAYSTCFGHHYAHHQELESIIHVVAACDIWFFGFQVVGMVWSWGLCVRFAGCCFKAAACKPNTIKSAINIIYCI